MPQLSRLLVVLVLAGCAAIAPRPRDPGLFLLPPEDAGFEATLTQAITISKAKSEVEVIAMVEISRRMTKIAAVSPLGSRVLALTWDGQHLDQERDPSLPAEFPAELVLRDMQLAYWSENSLRKRLPEGWHVEVTPRSRRIFKQGDPVIVIQFLGDRFKDPILFEHKSLGYKLTIRRVNDD